MRKVYFIIGCLFLLAGQQGQAQTIAGWDFTGVGTTSLPTYAATTFSANLISTSGASNITRGGGAAWSTASNSFRTVGFKNDGIVVANTDYFQVTLQATSGNKVSLSSIDAFFAGTATFAASPGVSSQFAYSLDGTTFTLIGSSAITIGTPATMATINLSGISALQNVASGTTITLRYYASGQTTTGGWGFISSASGVNGLAIGGTVAALVCSVPGDVISPSATAGNTQVSVGWTNPSCFDSFLVVQSTSAISGTLASGASPSVGGSLFGGTVVYKNIGSPTTSSAIFTGLTNGTPYFYRIYTKLGTTWNAGVNISPTSISPAGVSLATDYFKSNTGHVAKDWATVTSWQSSPDNGTTPWITATLAPTSSSAGITIIALDTITVSTTVSLDQTTVYGVLLLKSESGVFNINDGTGDDITIMTGGYLTVGSSPTSKNYITTFTSGVTTWSIHVNTGGVIQAGTTTDNLAGYSALAANAGTSPATVTNTTWDNAATFLWNTPSSFATTSATYFPGVSATTIPIFKVTQGSIVGANSNTLINGLFQTDKAMTFSNNGTKTFRNGIIGTGAGTITQDATCGQFIINGSTAQLGGTTIALNTTLGTTPANTGLIIASGTVATMIANQTITSSASDSVMINGTLDASTYTIANTGIPFAIIGTFKTANPNGFYGASNTAIINSPTIKDYNTVGTIEYSSISVAQNITPLTDYYNLTISGSGVKSLLGSTTSNGLLKLLAGNAIKLGSNKLTIDSLSGMGTLTGSSVSSLVVSTKALPTPVPTSTLYFTTGGDTLGNLSLKTASKVSLGTTLSIAPGTSNAPGVLTVNSGNTLTTNDLLTLKSTSIGTAHVGISPGTISGKVTVERYFPSHRSWRFMTAPISSSAAPTINASWQEGLSNFVVTSPKFTSQYGTIITKSTVVTTPDAGVSTTTGYDKGTTNNPSILSYDNVAKTWNVPTATNTGAITDNSGCYMLFVRGSRNYIVGTNYTPSTVATLRVKGNLKQGLQSYNNCNGLTAIGNPYASTISYEGFYNNATASTLADYYYAWDPLMTGNNYVGAFLTIKRTGANTYIETPDPSTVTSGPPINATAHKYDAGNIESSQAIFTYFVSTGSSVIQESDKLDTNTTYAFRPATGPDATLANPSQSMLKTNLFAINSDSTCSLEDGVLNLYGSQYSNTIDNQEDAPKLGNMLETVALLRNSKKLAIECRQPLTSVDTVYYNVAGFQQKQYIIQFIAKGIDQSLTGFVIDSFLHTRTPLKLNDTTEIRFAVTSNAASAAGSRFMVVFRQAEMGPSPLPVTFTSVKAMAQLNKNILVLWKVENQININQYEIEKSTDGIHFTGTTTLLANDLSVAAYNWLDKNGVEGANYYRIVSIGDNGAKQYSTIVKVEVVDNEPSSIVVYPNPVKGSSLGLKLSAMPGGKYLFALHNTLGQSLLNTEFKYLGGTGLQQVNISDNFAKGVYQLEITTPDTKKITLNVEFE